VIVSGTGSEINRKSLTFEREARRDGGIRSGEEAQRSSRVR